MYTACANAFTDLYFDQYFAFVWDFWFISRARTCFRLY